MKNHSTRKFFLSIVFCFALMSARAQYVTIPDTNFVNWIKANINPTCMNGNQMDTTCSTIINTQYIDCSNSNIYDLTGIQYFKRLLQIRCWNNFLVTLPVLPDSLTDLDCGYNQISSLPTLPDQLIYLECQDNVLTSLVPLPASLTYLYCPGNQLTSLPNLPSSLTVLICDQNQLLSLPFLPITLQELWCQFNQLSSLPVLPSLTSLRCGYNQLSSLPNLQNSLTELICYQNQLTNLPALPASLTVMGCSGNQLTSLPALPSSLTDMDCSGNQLTSLPSLPSSLYSLHCSSNLLTSLPTLPSGLIYFWCSFNQLTALPPLPGAMQELWMNDNPNLICLPPINYIYTFRWANTGITCLPNSINIGYYALPPITNTPLCAFSNPNNCPVYWSISGKTFTDTSGNCLADTNEVLLRNLKVKLYSGGILKQQAFSNDLGQYAFTADTGNYVYAIDTTSLPLDVVCPISFSFSTYLTNGNPQNPDKDFSLECKAGFDIGVSSVLRKSGRFRPGNYATVNVLAGDISNHYNLHCATGITGTVTVVVNGPASFINATSGALTPVVNGDTLIYSITDFGSVNFQNDFSFIVQTDTTAQVGDQVCFDVTVTPLAWDNNTANNFYNHCFTVTNSFDPNEKEVSPSGSIDTSQHWLTYTIYFQNTGNDTTLHVYVLDTLDNAIDESSIQLLAYSHEPLVQVMGNIVKFNFPNINLPDSTTDEPNSHGYVQYKVRIKNTAPVGTIIHNTGYIYFDFNSPVVTNTTFNQIDIITGLTPGTSPKERGVVADIYPNPVRSGGELKIVFNASNAKQASLNIFDMNGRKVFMQSINSSPQTQSVRLPFLAMGIYQCVIDYGNGMSRNKLVIAGK